MAKNALSGSPIVAKIFLGKIFKLGSHYRLFGFRAMFLLILLLNNHFIEKQSSKKHLIWPIGTSGFEIVFTLLVKAVAFQV